MLLKPFARKSLLAAGSVALIAGAVCTHSVRAQMAMGDDTMTMGDKMPMSDAEKKTLMEHMGKMKDLAANPKTMMDMKEEIVKMMVMQKMADKLSTDPDFMAEYAKQMADPNVGTMFEAARKAATDPATKEQMEYKIMADNDDINRVVAKAMMMTKMQERLAMETKEGEEKK